MIELIDKLDYKNYIELIKMNLLAAKVYGFNYKDSLGLIRSKFLEDIESSKRIKNITFSSLAQFLLITLLTWSFLLIAGEVLSLKIGVGTVKVVIALQVLGVIIFLSSVYVLALLKISLLEEIEIGSNHLRISLDVGKPVSLSIEKSKLLRIIDQSEKKMVVLTRLKFIIQNLVRNGEYSSQELDDIIIDLKKIKKEYLLSYAKMVELIRLIILMLFFLPGYFIAIYSISSQLLNS